MSQTNRRVSDRAVFRRCLDNTVVAVVFAALFADVVLVLLDWKVA